MQTLQYAPPSPTFWRNVRYSRNVWATLGRSVFAAVVLVLGIILTAGLLFALSFSPFYSVLVASVCFGAVVRIFTELRHRWSLRVLFHVEAAVRTRIPLTDYLRVAADSEGRVVRKRLLSTVELLERGTPLASALQSGASELGAHESRLIHAGERTGRLPEMLARISRTTRERQERQIGIGFFYRWYLPLVAFLIVVPIVMIDLFVMPRFFTIMKDFKIETTGLADFALQFPIRFVTEFWWLALVVLVGPAAWWAVQEVLHVLAPTNPGLERRRWPSLLPRIPFIGAVGRNRALADLCWILACDVRAGVPLDESVREIASLPLDADLNRKADRWYVLLEDGASPAAAARRAGMPELLCCILNTPGDSDGLADALEITGDLYDARHGRARAVIEAIAIPLIICVLASVVVLAALTLFLPLLAMIDHLLMPIPIGGAK